MSNLAIRALTAAIALIVLVTTTYFFHESGLVALCILMASLGIYEMSLLLFREGYPKHVKTIFFLVGLLHLNFGYPEQFIAGSFLLAAVGSIIFHKRFSSIDSLLVFISRFVMGIIYSATLPFLITSMILEPHGILWFTCLIAVVFSGDTGAYIAGTLFGKTKIAPLLSPKKSLEGSLGGLFFSALAGFIFSFIIPGVSPVLMIALGFFGGFLGQIGDFFESLLKRVAGVKDSGFIMPGHGGVLDRIDGVYFASTLFYVVVNYIIK